MIQYCVKNLRFIKITKKHCFNQDDIGKLRGILNIQIEIKNVNTDRCIDQYTRNTVGTIGPTDGTNGSTNGTIGAKMAPLAVEKRSVFYGYHWRQ